LWFPEPLARTVDAGAQLVLVPNASPFERDKHAQRDGLLAERIAESGVALAYLNVVGGQDAVVFDGASVIADGDGTVHPAARAFEDHLLVADFDPDTRKFAPVHWPAEVDEGRDALAWRAIVRGTRDYCAKNGFDKVWLGLSGGLDSSVVLAIAVDALGAQNVTAVRLPSRFTAGMSNDLAAAQCASLGVRLETVSIEAPFKGFMEALGPLFADRAPDVAEENLQSRSRGVLLMALSNKFGWLVVSTGNKSELAVGYSTLYGDMVGGFSLLKDVFKTDVFRLAAHLNAQAGRELVPASTIARAPSAELRADQRDADSIPPYEVLDPVLEAYVELDRSREELLETFDREVVEQVLALVDRAEYKRRQAPPGVKLRPKAFGRDRRTPITNRWRG